MIRTFRPAWTRWAAGLCTLAFVACEQPTENTAIGGVPDGRLTYSAAPGGKHRSATTADLLTWPTFNQVWGASTLTRSDHGLRVEIETTGLTKGNAYTIWMLIFNNPAGCMAGGPGVCDGPDLFNDLAEPDMMWVAGKIAGNQDVVRFSGHKRVGSTYGTVQSPLGAPSHGVTNPQGAAVWFVVHDHGKKLPDFMPDMIRSIDGGCYDAGTPFPNVASPWNTGPTTGPQLPGYGRRGPNECAGRQISFHNP